MRIENQSGEVLGKLDDLILDPESGKVRYSVLVSGSFLGIGRSRKLVPVPGISMATAKRNTLALITPDSRWRALLDFRTRDLVHLQSRAKNEPQLELASRLLGKTVSDKTQHKLGAISDLVVDLSSTRPSFAIVALKGDTHLAIPLQALGPRATLSIEISLDSLSQAPWFGRQAWQRSSTNNQMVIYRYDDTRTKNIPPDLGDSQQHALRPGGQSQELADLRAAQRIRRAVTNHPTLSITAKNIKIIAANGKVTLRGPVQTAQEKMEISRLASEVVGVSNISNQLEIERK